LVVIVAVVIVVVDDVVDDVVVVVVVVCPTQMNSNRGRLWYIHTYFIQGST
jgi:hypothetical protein